MKKITGIIGIVKTILKYASVVGAVVTALSVLSDELEKVNDDEK